jgi:sulfoxide reductase heme-binding subunit YedZ
VTEPGTFAWVVVRVAGLSSYTALVLAVLTGVALRTGVLDWLASNRSLRSMHDFTTLLWPPLGLLHMLALLFDPTAQVRALDLALPFQAAYATLALGLGTVSAWLLGAATLAGLMRTRLPTRIWQLLHRGSYLAFALIFVHALLAGTDFSDPAISALTWGAAGAAAVLLAARLLVGRLPA